jgi:anti-repressor protein
MTNELGIFTKDNKAVVSSRKIAEVFEKEHKHVMETIRKLDCNEEFNQSNFRPVEYKDAKGEMRPEYLITRDGFTLLAMGFTGKKAMEFKVKYIAAFNAMEEELAHRVPAGLPDFTNPIIAARAWADAEEGRLELAAQVERDAPKVLFADSVAAAHTDILIGELAKLLRQNGVEMGQTRLFAWLRDKGYLMKTGSSRNMPTQKAMEAGLFRIKETVINKPDGSVHISKTPKVTGRGQVFFVNVFLGQNQAA